MNQFVYLFRSIHKDWQVYLSASTRRGLQNLIDSYQKHIDEPEDAIYTEELSFIVDSQNIDAIFSQDAEILSEDIHWAIAHLTHTVSPPASNRKEV